MNRRDFLDIVAKIAAGVGVAGAFTESIARAAAIEPAKGSSFLDAEHVVILMQENRSFDHAFGTLRGVRGFNDPRAITLPDGNPVWVQADAKGNRFAPFAYDIKDTRITWMGSLPHGWTDQTDARNGGLYDKWLTAKRAGGSYSPMPLTLGYYRREDIPFYYALADAFTVCDQYFCSSLTGTTPNRCYLWTGTVRDKMDASAFAVVRNEEADLGTMVEWPTFPERLEELGISWKCYQNELTIGTGLTGEQDAWLANFGDNPLEYFKQYHIELAAGRAKFVVRKLAELRAELAMLREKILANQDVESASNRAKEVTANIKTWEKEQKLHVEAGLDKLPPREREIHEKAFAINDGDPHYRELAEITYMDGTAKRRLRAPKGDLFYQFRKDVSEGKLPTVSWLTAPQVFSDHPSSAWYGSWYLAEVMDILTSNPEVWKKTVFILTYDENDGYYDHVPPFVAPHPNKPETGKCSAGIDTSVDWVMLEQDKKRSRYPRESSIGLGYRVPFVIASPWTRGGNVCSQVFDHTSPIQFLEKLLSHKLGKEVKEPNITPWRRAVSGDLTAAFQDAPKSLDKKLEFQPRDTFLEEIHKAQFKGPPTGFKALTAEEQAAIRKDPRASKNLPKQEPGTKPSAPLPYELSLEGILDDDRKQVELTLEAAQGVHGKRAAGAPFTVYALTEGKPFQVRNYAVAPGKKVEDAFLLTDFPNENYHLRAYGPNGFYRELVGSASDFDIRVSFGNMADEKDRTRLTGDGKVIIVNFEIRPFAMEVIDNLYKNPKQAKDVAANVPAFFVVNTQNSGGWYDVTVRITGVDTFSRRFAGRIETGRWSISDPAMG